MTSFCSSCGAPARGRWCGECGSALANSVTSEDAFVHVQDTVRTQNPSYDTHLVFPDEVYDPYEDQPYAPVEERRSRALPIMLALLAVLLIPAAAIGVFLVLRSTSGSNAGASALPQATAFSPAPVTATTAVAGRAAAVQISTLMNQSQQSRQQVNAAATDLNDCTNLSAASAVFASAASSRRTLISQIQQVDLSGIPNGQTLTDNLVRAWTLSAQADDLLQEAADSAQCDVNDPVRQSEASLNDQAHAAKKIAAAEWNQIAPSYGLNPVVWDTL